MPLVAVADKLLDSTGIGLTVNIAALELTDPALLLHTARYCLLLSAMVTAKVNVALVAPGIFVHVVPVGLDCHCTVGDGAPLAAEVKLVFVPEHFAWDAGCVETVGARIDPSGLTVTTRFCVLLHPAAFNV